MARRRRLGARGAAALAWALVPACGNAPASQSVAVVEASVAVSAPPPAPVEPTPCAPPGSAGLVTFAAQGAAATACDARHIAVLSTAGSTSLDLGAPAGEPSDDAIAMQWDPAGERLAIVRADGVRLWSRSGGLLSARLHENSERQPGATFHRSRPWIATFDRAAINDHEASTGRGVTIWDTTTGAEVAHLKDGGVIQQVAWYPLDDDLLMVAGGEFSFGMGWAWNDDFIRIWSVSRRAEVGRLRGHTVTVSAEGKVLAIDTGHRRSGGRDSMGMEQTGATLMFVDAKSRKPRKQTPGVLLDLSRDGSAAFVDPAARDCNQSVFWRGGAVQDVDSGSMCVNVWDADGARWATADFDKKTFTIHAIAPGSDQSFPMGASKVYPIALEGAVVVLHGEVEGTEGRRIVQQLHRLDSGRRLELRSGITSRGCELCVVEGDHFDGSSELVERACDDVRAPKSRPGLLGEFITPQ